jgi:hypothetical protein
MKRMMSPLLLAIAGLAILPQVALAGQFKKPVYYNIGTLPYSIVTADFNQDGNLDLAVADWGTSQVSILLGRGDGTFHHPQNFSAPAAIALAVGDFNGDHIQDLAVVQFKGTNSGSLSIYLGDGGGFHHSATYSLGVEPVSVVVADFNGDGVADIAVANRMGFGQSGKEGAVMIFLGDGHGRFRKPAIYKLPGAPHGLAVGDLNGDGSPDLVVTHDATASVTVLMNSGRGSFRVGNTYSAGTNANGVALADLNHKGKLDMVVASTPGVAVLLGNGDGTFNRANLYPASSCVEPQNVAIEDFNLDGNADIAIACFQQESALFYGKGDGTFSATVPIKLKNGSAAQGIASGHFRNDYGPDLAMTILSGSVAVLLNTQ